MNQLYKRNEGTEMKKIILIGSLLTLSIGLVGCDAGSTKKSSMKESNKVENTPRSSSSVSSKQSTEKSSEQTVETTESSDNDGKLSDVGFKELLSCIEYNKEYLTEDQIAELKDMHKADLTDEQYQEFVKVLE